MEVKKSMISKKLIIAVLYFNILIAIIGCEISEIPNRNALNESLVNKVKLYERNEYLFDNLAISYNEYKKNIRDIVVSFFPYKDNQVVFVYNDIKLKGEDLEKMTSKEWEVHKNKIASIFAKNNNDIVDTAYEISDVHNSKDYNRKYVFVKIIKKYNYKNNLETHTNKRYTFSIEDGKWKIINISSKSAEWKEENDKLSSNSKKQYLEKTAYFSVNNKPVEYKEHFYPAQPQ